MSIARISQIEQGEVTSFEVIARCAEALGGRLDFVADFGDRTVRLPVGDITPIRRLKSASSRGIVADGS